MQYFIFSYRLSSEDGYLIWAQDESDSKKDHFLVDESGKIPSFISGSKLERYAAKRELKTNREHSHILNLDVIVGWLSIRQAPSDCNELLDAWNAFSDVASSVPSDSSFRAMNFSNNHLYDKIFWGSNLPTVTPEGEHFDPTWSTSELDTLATLLTAGIDLFTSSIHRFAE